MKKYGGMIVFLWIVFLIQNNIFSIFNLISIKPNIMLIAVIGYGLVFGQKEGMIAGIISGAMLDCFGSGTLCFYALPYMYIGYSTGYFKQYLNYENFVIPGVFAGVSDLALGFYVFVFRFAIRNRMNLSFYLKSIILPEILYTVILAILLFQFFTYIQRKIDRWAKRRGKKIADKRHI